MSFIRFEEGSGYCGKCLKQVPVYRAKVKHWPYLCLALLTLGVSIYWWIRDAKKVHPWKCIDCGATVYKVMS